MNTDTAEKIQKVGATFIPSLDGFAISENDLQNVINERDEARAHALRLADALHLLLCDSRHHDKASKALAQWELTQ